MGSSYHLRDLSSRCLRSMIDGTGEHFPGEIIERCEACGDPTRLWITVEIDGAEYLVSAAHLCKCGRLAEEAERQRIEHNKLERIRSKCFKYIPKSIIGEKADLDDWGMESTSLHDLGMRLVAAFDGTGKTKIGFTMSGDVGIGKTFLLWAIANRCIEFGVKVRLLSVPQLLESMKATFDNCLSDESEASILADILSAEVILIDELGVGKQSEWMYDVLYKLIDQAVATGKVIVCATNLSEDQLKKYLADPQTGSPRLSQRLFTCAPFVPVDGRNFRIEQEQEAGMRLNE